MARFTADQLTFAASKKASMARSESIEFLETMHIRHAVGHWSAGDFYDRFAPPGYHSDDPSFSSTFEAQCRRTKAAGVDAIEIHPTRTIERGMINFANLSLEAVRVLAQQPALDRARAAGTGPDVLDVVPPILVG